MNDFIEGMRKTMPFLVRVIEVVGGAIKLFLEKL
jgi:hypothetical protein